MITTENSGNRYINSDTSIDPQTIDILKIKNNVLLNSRVFRFLALQARNE
jgi:hypothetical protein